MPTAVMPTTQHDLRLATRMSRLGTETAFEVLNRARALEKQGKDIVHLEIGEPDFDTPAQHRRCGRATLCIRAGRITVRRPACPTCGRRSPNDVAAAAKCAGRAAMR